MKLALRFLLPTVVGIFLALALYAMKTFEREVQAFDDDALRDHEVLARALGPAFIRVWGNDGPGEAQLMLSRVNAHETALRSRWVWENSADAPQASAKRTPSGLIVDWQGGADDPELVSFVAMEAAGRSGFIEIRESMRLRRQYVMTSLLRTSLTALGIFAWTAGVVVALGVILIARPLRALVKHAQRLGSGQFEVRTQAGRRDEIGALALEMNRTAQLLQQNRETLAKETAERMRILNELRHADRLATVGKLASGIAHELGTPLNVVQGRARMISSRSGDNDAKRNAEVIDAQVQRMTSIIRQLLDFTRSERSEKRRVDASKLVTRVLSLLRPIAEARHVTLQFESSDSAGGEVDADPSQLEQVLTNLIVNAMQAMPEPGCIRVHLTQEKAREEADSDLLDYSVLRISDPGTGMPPQVAARVFEPFFTTKPVGEGTGLGLSVAYGIVHEHGGFMRVDSKEGRGTTFSVYLPLAAEVKHSGSNAEAS